MTRSRSGFGLRRGRNSQGEAFALSTRETPSPWPMHRQRSTDDYSYRLELFVEMSSNVLCAVYGSRQMLKLMSMKRKTKQAQTALQLRVACERRTLLRHICRQAKEDASAELDLTLASAATEPTLPPPVHPSLFHRIHPAVYHITAYRRVPPFAFIRLSTAFACAVCKSNNAPSKSSILSRCTSQPTARPE